MTFPTAPLINGVTLTHNGQIQTWLKEDIACIICRIQFGTIQTFEKENTDVTQCDSWNFCVISNICFQ